MEDRSKKKTQEICVEPIGDDVMGALFEHLMDKLEAGCDGTLLMTEECLKTQGVEDIEGACKWLNSLGARCDCEVILNACRQK